MTAPGWWQGIATLHSYDYQEGCDRQRIALHHFTPPKIPSLTQRLCLTSQHDLIIPPRAIRHPDSPSSRRRFGYAVPCGQSNPQCDSCPISWWDPKAPSERCCCLCLDPLLLHPPWLPTANSDWWQRTWKQAKRDVALGVAIRRGIPGVSVNCICLGKVALWILDILRSSPCCPWERDTPTPWGVQQVGKMSHLHDYAMSPPEDFSTLEVRPIRKDETLKEVLRQPARLVTTFSRIVGSSDVSAVSGSYDASQRSAISPPSVTSSSNSVRDLLPDKEANGDTPQKPRRICGLSLRIFWPLFISVLLVIAVAIGVPVGLHVQRGSKAAASSSPGPTLPTATPQLVPAPHGPGASNSSSVAISPSSKLASMTWIGLDGVLQYRLYFQDDQQMIRETAWNASSKSWALTQTIGKAKLASPIAAVVTGPSDHPFVSDCTVRVQGKWLTDAQQLNIYAIDEDGLVIEWVSTDGMSFNPGGLTDLRLPPANSSGLTAIWDRWTQCPTCANTLLFAYERPDGHLEVGNLTDQGWRWTQLQSSTATGTSLALALHWQESLPGDIRLYYQTPKGDLVSQSYNTTSGNHWQSLESLPIDHLGSIVPLTTFTWGNVPNPEGDLTTAFNPILSSSYSNITDKGGIRVNSWNGRLGEQDSAFPQTPDVLADARAISLAANIDKHAYALERGRKGGGNAGGLLQVREYEMGRDGITWTLVGTVVTAENNSTGINGSGSGGSSG